MRKTNVVWVGFLLFLSTSISFGGGFWDILFPTGGNPDDLLRAHAQQLLTSLQPQQVVEVDESIINNDDVQEDDGIVVIEVDDEVDDTAQAQALEDALFALHRYLAWQALYAELRVVLEMDDGLAPQVARMLIQAFCNGLCCDERVRARLLRLDSTDQLAGNEAALIELLTHEEEPLNQGAFQELVERVIDVYQGIVEQYLGNEANAGASTSLMHFLLGTVVQDITTDLRQGNQGDEAPVLMGMNFNVQVLIQIQRWADRYDPHFHLWQHANVQHQQRLFGAIRNYQRFLTTRRDWVLAQLLGQADEVVEPAKDKKEKDKGKRSANKKEDRVYDDEETDDSIILSEEYEADKEDEDSDGIIVVCPNRDRSSSESSEEDDDQQGLTIFDEDGNELQQVNLADYTGRSPSELLWFVIPLIEEQHHNTLRLGQAGAPMPVQDLWLSLPPELWIVILEYLDSFGDLLSISRACMFLHGLTICPNWQRSQNVLSDGSVQVSFRSESQRNLFTRLGLRFLKEGKFREAARCFAIQGCFEGLILPHNYGGLCHIGHYLKTLQGANHLPSIIIPACQQAVEVGTPNLIIANHPIAVVQQALLNAIAEHYFGREIVLPRSQQIALDSTVALKRRIRALIHWQTLLHQRGDTRVPPIEEIWDLHSMALVMGVPFEQAEALINTLKQLCLRFKKAKNTKAKNFVASILWDLLLIAQSTRAIEPLRLLALDAFGDLVDQLRPAAYDPFIDTMAKISINNAVPLTVRNKALSVLMKMTGE